MPDEIATPEEVGQDTPDGPLDSLEEIEDVEPELSEDEDPLEGEEDDVEDAEDGDADPPPVDMSEQRIQELEAQMTAQTQQHNNEMQQMRRYVHDLGMQPPQQRQGQSPVDLDDMTREQYSQYSVGQAVNQSNQYANQVARDVMARVSRVQETFNGMLEAIIETREDKDVLLGALESMTGTSLTYKQSLEIQRGKVDTKRATVAQKQLDRQKKESQKRSRKASSQGRRPKVSPARKTSGLSSEEALRMTDPERRRKA